MDANARWSILAICVFARLAMGFQFQSIASLSAPLQQLYQIDLAYVGLLIGLYSLPGIVIALPGGMLGARFGDKRIALIGLGLMACGGLIVAIAATPNELTVGRLVSGIGAILFNVTITKMVTDWFIGREIVLAMAILMNTWPIGIGLAIWVFGTLNDVSAVPLAMGLTAIFAILGMVALAIGYRPVPGAPVFARLVMPGKAEMKSLLIVSMPWMLYNAAYAIFVSYVPGYLVQRGVGATAAAITTALATLLFVVSVQVGGILVQRFGRAQLFALIGLTGYLLSLMLMIYGSAPLLFTLCAGLVGGIPAGILVSLPAGILSPASRSSGMGIFYTAYYLGMAVFPPFAGWAAQASGSRVGAIAVAIIALIAVTVVLPWAMRSKPAST